MVSYLKKRFRDPYMIVTGDFNHWKIQDVLVDFSDFSEEKVGPTRGSRCIDRVLLKVGRAVEESGMLAPLETEEDEQGLQAVSDHRVVFVKVGLRRKETFRWEKYSY